MPINLKDKISMRIGGEIGKFQTISVDKLNEIATNFQKLINAVAKHDIEVDGAINLDNFKIELCGFHGGSAIPDLCFTSKVIPTVFDYEAQRGNINVSLSALLEIAATGNYEILKEKYPDYIRRNEIVESLYQFRNTFGKSPVEIGYYNGKFKSNYSLKEFKSSTKNSLVVEIADKKIVEKTEYKAFGQIKVTLKKGKPKIFKVEEELNFQNHSLTYSPEIIIHGNTQYILHHPLHCTLLIEDGYYTIKNDYLDIIAVEEESDEAELSFNEQFDYLYNRLLNASNATLTRKMQQVKQLFKIIVKEKKRPMVIDKKETVRNLKKKGFVESSSKSDDHIYLEYIYDGKLALITKVSRGSTKDIGIPLIKQMSHQCKLSNKDFIDLAKCPLSASEYNKILKDSGVLD